MPKRLLAAVIVLGALGVSILPQVARAGSGEVKVVALGLTDHKVTEEELAKGDKLPTPHFNTPAVAYVLATNLKKGDSVEITLKNGNAPLLHNIQQLTEDQASLLLQAGKTGVPAGGWPEGTYTASLEIKRDGKSLISQSSEPVPFD
jgi:acetamidase/formamidase